MCKESQPVRTKEIPFYFFQINSETCQLCFFVSLTYVQSRNKVPSLNFYNCLQVYTQNCNSKVYWFQGMCSKVSIFSGHQVCLVKELFFLAIKKIHFFMSKKKQTKKTQQVANLQEIRGIKSLSPIITSKKIKGLFIRSDSLCQLKSVLSQNPSIN